MLIKQFKDLLSRLFNILALSLFIFYLYASVTFVWHDNLTTFASDSVNYMIMGKYLSPWKEASSPINELWLYQDFPPLFPIVLALTGTAHNFISAHILTLSFLILSLPFIYKFSRHCFASKTQALCITALFMISPSAWLNMLGILSEHLYILVSFILIFLYPRLVRNDIKLTILFGLLLAMLILTRSIGISMFVAFLISGYLMWHKKEIKLNTLLLPFFIVILVNVIAKLLHHSSVPTQYLNQIKNLEFGQQLQALIDAWFKSWQFYWTDELIFSYTIVLFIGVLACTGLVIRLKELKFDAIYALFYLLILLVWPHPGQAVRFLYPVQALLLIYSFYTIYLVCNISFEAYKNKIIYISILLMCSIVIPPLSYLYHRYSVGKELGYNHIKEFYRIPDIKKAREQAEIQSQMFVDFKKIGEVTEPDDIILYFEPSYIALLSNRNSRPLNTSLVNGHYAINDLEHADYVYLSRLHPRKTQENINGLDMLQYIGSAELINTNYSRISNQVISYFLKTRIN